MTILDNGTRNQYTAAALQAIFAYTFEIFDKGDVAVEQNGTLLSEGTHYTVSNVGNDSGGNITLVTGASSGDIMTIYRDMALERLTDFQQSGDFLSDEVNDDFDRLWAALQQNNNSVSRAIRASIDDSVLNNSNTELTTPLLRANKALGFSSTGALDYFSGALGVGTLREYSTMAAAISDVANISIGDILIILERSSGNGGGGYWNAVDATLVTENEFDIVTASGSISFQLVIGKNIELEQLGVVLDGTNADSEIARAIVLATPSSKDIFFALSGGKNITFGSGLLGVGVDTYITEFINLIGNGKGLSTIKLLASGAKIRFGTGSSSFGASERGGSSGGFSIDGNDLAHLGLHIGFIVERDFHDINVFDCKGTTNGDGILVEAAQNCNFFGVSSQHNGGIIGVGSNIVFDYGAGNNRFYGAEVNRPGAYNVKFIQSGASPTGAFSVPTGNRFYGPMIERWEDQDGGGTVTSLGSIYHGAGRQNYFDNPDMSLTALPSALPMVIMRKDGSGASNLLTFNNPKFHGSASWSTVFDLADAITLMITGVAFFENHAKIFEVSGTGVTVNIDRVIDSSGGIWWTGSSGAVEAQTVFRLSENIYDRYFRSATSKEVIRTYVDGDNYAQPRWQLRADGHQSWGASGGNPDVTLYRGSANKLQSDDRFYPIDGLQVKAKAGVPVDGDLNLVADSVLMVDTSNSRLYIRVGGVWKYAALT